MKDYTIYVTEEIAKKTMEKGFECQRVYENRFLGTHHDEFIVIDLLSSPASALIYKLPTAEQICGWLRNEKNIEVSIARNKLTDYPYRSVAYLIGKEDYAKVSDGYDYKDTLLECINKALDLI